MSEIHPELRRTARFVPRFTFTPRLASFVRGLQRWRGTAKVPKLADVSVRDVMIPGPPGNSALRIRLYSPYPAKARQPAMLWIHGGGFIIGTPEQDEKPNIALCRELGIAVAAVDYRLAPDHPYPAPMDDCYAALVWLHDQAEALGIDPQRIAIGGSSAGAGLAAGLALMAHDRGEVPVAFQLLFYPMLDDRTTLRNAPDKRCFRVWNSKSNKVGWSSYLGREPGQDDIPAYAAPARRENLAGLPPAWIGVGTCDLFHDDDVDYARRLSAAGVPCTLKVIAGGFHGFDLVCPEAEVSREFQSSGVASLRTGLGIF